MKIKSPYIGLTILCFTILFYACEKMNNLYEESDIQKPQATEITLFKDYFYQMVKSEGRRGPSFTVKSASIQVNQKYAIWKKAYYSETKNGTFLEVPIVYNQRFATIFKKNKKDDKSINEEIFKGSFDRLIIYKNKISGVFDRKLITYIPDINYLRKYHNDISHNHLDKLDSDFTGFLEYKNWDGTKLFTLQKENGKTVKKFYYTASGNISAELISTIENNRKISSGLKEGKLMSINIKDKLTMGVYICGVDYVDIMGESCIDAGPDDGSSGGSPVCTPYLISTETVYTYCDDGNDPPCSTCDLTGNDCLDYGIGCPENTNNDPSSAEDPCARKGKVIANASDTTISKKNNALNTTITTNNPDEIEYGTQFDLNSPDAASSYKPSYITSGGAGWWESQPFHWDSSSGYSIGESHTHIDGMAPSPADVMHMAKNLATVVNSGVGIEFYKANVSTTVVTQWGNWVVTVKDWPAFITEYNVYKNMSLADYNANYLAIGGGTNQPPGARFLSKFGAYLSLYKADPNTTNFQPLKLGSNGSPEPISCN